MNPLCKVCSAEMQLRNGKYGQFYFCANSTAKDSHGTINKAAYDALCLSGLANVYRADSEDRQMKEHLHRIATAGGLTVEDFYTDYHMAESKEWPNILPNG